MSTSEGYHEYIGRYHEYIGGCSVHWRDVLIHVGDIISTSGDVQYIGVFNINQSAPHMNHDIPPMYSWYLSDVVRTPPDELMISPT